MSAPHSQAKQIPRDAAVMQTLLKEMGVTAYEPRVVNQMLEYAYRYVTGVVEEAKVYSSYAKKKTVDKEDVSLAVEMLTEKTVSCVPPRELLMEMAKAKNAQPLPVLKLSSGPGVRLPPDRFCLTQPNYRLKLNSDATVSSTSNTGRSWVTGLKLPGTPKGFKTPSGVAPRSISSVSSSSSAGSSPLSQPIHFSANVQLGGNGSPTITLVASSPPVQSSSNKRKFSEDDDMKH